LYYASKQDRKDWRLKNQIEDVLDQHPSYGYRRVAIAIQVNKKRTQRVMRRFGLHAYRRRGRKWRKTKEGSPMVYPNLLRQTIPLYPGHVWAADFTYLWYKGKVVYLATVLDLFSREVVGWSLMTTHTVPLILQALFVGLHGHARPAIFHSDNGREYISQAFTGALDDLGTAISRSRPGCPWENGYQESFYSQFKVELGDPNRFASLGELVYEIYKTIHTYNHSRIHSALRMAPLIFLQQRQMTPEKVSYVWGS
jgi:transposase InsO family protein